MTAKDKTKMQITIPIKLKKLLEKKAEENNRSASNYIVTLIKKDVEE